MQISWKKRVESPQDLFWPIWPPCCHLKTIYISVEWRFCYFQCFKPVGGLLERISISFTANGKREFVPLDQVFPLIVFFFLSFTVHYNYRKIGRFTPILSLTVVLSCFYLLISHFKHFSTWISFLPFAVNAMLNKDLRVRSFEMIRISNSDPRSLGSNEPMNPLWTRIHRFIWSTMIRVISDHWSWSGSSQRKAP